MQGWFEERRRFQSWNEPVRHYWQQKTDALYYAYCGLLGGLTEKDLVDSRVRRCGLCLRTRGEEETQADILAGLRWKYIAKAKVDWPTVNHATLRWLIELAEAVS